MKSTDQTPLHPEPQKAHPERQRVSRREFARRAALGTAAAITTVPLSPLVTRHSPLSDQSPDPAKLSPQSQAEADARFQSILAQYPDRFSDAQKADLKRLCFVAQQPLDALRSWPVANSDQPALYLKPIVEREKKNNAAPNLKFAPAKPAASAKP